MASARICAAFARLPWGASADEPSGSDWEAMVSAKARARSVPASRASTSACSTSGPPWSTSLRSACSCARSADSMMRSAWRWSSVGSRPGGCAARVRATACVPWGIWAATAAAMINESMLSFLPGAGQTPPRPKTRCNPRAGTAGNGSGRMRPEGNEAIARGVPDSTRWEMSFLFGKAASSRAPIERRSGCATGAKPFGALGSRWGGSRLERGSGVIRGRWQTCALRRHPRGGPSAVLAERELVAPQLVAPVLALEGPELLVLVHLRLVAPRARRAGHARGSFARKLHLAPGDFVGEAKRLPEELAQLAA